MKMSLLVISLFLMLSTTVLSAHAGHDEDSRIPKLVQTAQGPVKGYLDPDVDVFSFYGIPYATSPTGADRFKAPLPGPSWITPFQPVSENIICPQYIDKELLPLYAKFKNLVITEDCLVANVFVPNKTEKNLPVMVVVHGGRFVYGAGNLVKPKNLVHDHNIIVVTFNYRLGAHGFLCLGTEAAPGNAGLKDQVALLRWVNKNIANFGGNPDDVTISGYSAGAISVNLLRFSPLAKGLFHKVIAESGDSLTEFAVQNDPTENAKRFARKLDAYNVDDVNSLETFYTTASFKNLTSFAYSFNDASYYLTPCLEIDVGQEIFLAESPYNILKSGQFNNVPILTGLTNGEGILALPEFDSYKNDMNANFSNYLPDNLQFPDNGEREKVARKVKEFYFGDKRVCDETVLSYVDYFSDKTFTYSLLKEVQFFVDAGQKDVYLFYYTYFDELTPVIPLTLEKRPGHTAESNAVYDGLPLLGIFTDDVLPADYKKHKQTIRQLWSNFIKTGAPVPAESSLPAWPPVGPQASPHMELGREPRLRGPLLQERYRLWDDIYRKYRGTPEMPNPFPYTCGCEEVDEYYYIEK